MTKCGNAMKTGTHFLGETAQIIQNGSTAKRIKINGRKIKVKADDIVVDKRGMEFMSDGKVWRTINSTWMMPLLGPHFETVKEYEDYLISSGRHEQSMKEKAVMRERIEEMEVRRKREKRKARGLAWRVKSWWRAWRRRRREIDRLRWEMADDLGSRVPIVGVFAAALASDEQVLEWDERRKKAKEREAGIGTNGGGKKNR